MSRNSVLFLSYWYPNKNSKIFPVFVKKHAQSISLKNNIVVLSFHIVKSSSFFCKKIEIIYDENKIETHQIYLESMFNKILYVILPIHYFIIKKYIKLNILPKYKIEIIHSNILFPCAIVGNWLANYFNCRHVITEHWSKLNLFFKKNIYKFFGTKTLNNAHAITCVSKILQKTVKEYTNNQNIYLVPNVIDQSEFYFDNTIQKNQTFTFIAAANWTLPKNPFYFLEALDHLKIDGKIMDFNLYLIGNGLQLEDIKKRNYNFKIIYTGIIDSNELRVYLNKSDMFLHGSDYETFSTIIAEALMCGIPCVVSPVGIAKEVVNSENGFITDNTPEDWYKKILLCYKQTYNQKVISEQLKDKYDLKTVGILFNKIYKNIISKP
jgi:glycosyltransferase involved in cell wall biosynthesis